MDITKIHGPIQRLHPTRHPIHTHAHSTHVHIHPTSSHTVRSNGSRDHHIHTSRRRARPSKQVCSARYHASTTRIHTAHTATTRGTIRPKGREAHLLRGAHRCRGDCSRLLLSDNRLSCGGLGLLSGDLLRFGNVGATVFSVVDAFSCPNRFRGQRVDDLPYIKRLNDAKREQHKPW